MNTYVYFNHLWGRTARMIINCPLFSFPMQCLYVLTALILPLVCDKWMFSNFLLVYFFAGLRLYAFILEKLIRRRKIDGSNRSQFSGRCLQKSLDHPEVDSARIGMILFIYLLCALSGSMILWVVGSFVCVGTIVLLQWYLLKKMP